MIKTDEHKIAHYDTWLHIHEVRKNINKIMVMLGDRALKHDISKMMDHVEMAIFAEFAKNLGNIEYGTTEYEENLKKLAPAIEQHHRANRHHPEFHRDGINSMNLVDIIEMVCDWKAATLRSKKGDIYKSLDVQKERFKMSDQLYTILRNTIPLLEE